MKINFKTIFYSYLQKNHLNIHLDFHFDFDLIIIFNREQLIKNIVLSKV